MGNTVDSNEVRVTGENSFIRLGEEAGGEFTTRASYWRVLYSPVGPGHALFIQSELTDHEVVAYSDEIALARWLQDEIEILISPPPFSDPNIRVIDAAFERRGDVRSTVTEEVHSRNDEILLQWSEMTEPLAVHAPPGTSGRSHGVYSIIISARYAQVSINGHFASGKPLRADREGRYATTACLAWSETWVRPPTVVSPPGMATRGRGNQKP
jgi:hypothetical protein